MWVSALWERYNSWLLFITTRQVYPVTIESQDISIAESFEAGLGKKLSKCGCCKIIEYCVEVSLRLKIGTYLSPMRLELIRNDIRIARELFGIVQADLQR